MPFSKSSVAVLLFAAPAYSFAQTTGSLTYGPVAAAPVPPGAAPIPVPIPFLLLLPLAITLVSLGYRALRRQGCRQFLGILLIASGAGAGAISSLYIQDAVAAILVELSEPGGGTVDVPLSDATYINTSGVVLKIGAVTPPPSCSTTGPVSECLTGLQLADGQSCNTGYDCESSFNFSDLTGTGPAGFASFKIVQSDNPGVEMLLTTKATTDNAFLQGSVNSDTDNIALNNQWIDPTNDLSETLRIDFGDFDITAGTFDILSHSSVNATTFQIVSTGGSSSNTVDVMVRVFDANDDNDLTNDSPDIVTRVVVLASDGATVLADAFSSGNVGGLGFTFHGVNGVIVDSLIAGYYLNVFTDDGYNRSEIKNVTSAAQLNDVFTVGGISGDL